MKTKDIIGAVVAAILLVVVGYLAFSYLVPSSPKSAGKSVQKVEVVGVIRAGLNDENLKSLKDKDKNIDFTVNLDLNSDLGNSSVFGR